MLCKYDHIHLASSDPKKAAEFYTKALGAQIIEQKAASGQETVDLDIGGILVRVSTIEEAEAPRKIEQPPKVRIDEPRFGLHHLGFWIDNLNETVVHLKSMGVEFIAEPIKEPGLWYTVIRAPDNVRIELKARAAD